MSQSAAIWFVVLLAFLAANLPFFTQRFLFYPVQPAKTLGHRAVELLVCYAVVGLLGFLLEREAGQVAPQTWEFFAITGTLFLTFAFPGFVYRYLLNHRA